jgi:hypothetical protein
MRGAESIHNTAQNRVKGPNALHFGNDAIGKMPRIPLSGFSKFLPIGRQMVRNGESVLGLRIELWHKVCTFTGSRGK